MCKEKMKSRFLLSTNLNKWLFLGLQGNECLVNLSYSADSGNASLNTANKPRSEQAGRKKLEYGQ